MPGYAGGASRGNLGILGAGLWWDSPRTLANRRQLEQVVSVYEYFAYLAIALREIEATDRTLCAKVFYAESSRHAISLESVDISSSHSASE